MPKPLLSSWWISTRSTARVKERRRKPQARRHAAQVAPVRKQLPRQKQVKLQQLQKPLRRKLPRRKRKRRKQLNKLYIKKDRPPTGGRSFYLYFCEIFY